MHPWLIINTVRARRAVNRGRRAHLVGLVVELGIDGVDVLLLRVLERGVQVVDIELFSPLGAGKRADLSRMIFRIHSKHCAHLFRVGEHELGLCQIKLPGPEEAEQRGVVVGGAFEPSTMYVASLGPVSRLSRPQRQFKINKEPECSVSQPGQLTL